MLRRQLKYTTYWTEALHLTYLSELLRKQQQSREMA